MRALLTLLVAAEAASAPAPTHRGGLLPQRHGAGSSKTVAAVVLSHNHEATVKRIADALSDEVDAIVIVEDGSTDNSYEAWRSALQDPTKTLSLFKPRRPRDPSI